MKVQTTRFGEIDVPDPDVISIPEGIPGFPEFQRYVLLEHDSEGTPFKWLQSLENGALAFIVMDPQLLISSLPVELDGESRQTFGAEQVDERFALMCIVNVPHENPMEMTINLRAPILVHLEKRIGKQIILADETYSIRHRIFPDPLPNMAPSANSSPPPVPNSNPSSDEPRPPQGQPSG